MKLSWRGALDGIWLNIAIVAAVGYVLLEWC